MQRYGVPKQLGQQGIQRYRIQRQTPQPKQLTQQDLLEIMKNKE